LASAGWRRFWISASGRGRNYCSDIFLYFLSSTLPRLWDFPSVFFSIFFSLGLFLLHQSGWPSPVNADYRGFSLLLLFLRIIICFWLSGSSV
jgi:hypothetical protein